MSNQDENASEQQTKLAEETPAVQKEDSGFREGMKLILKAHLCVLIPLLLLFMGTMGFLGLLLSIELLALIQWVYVIPAIIVFLIKRKPGELFGVLTVAGLTVIAGGALCAGTK